MEKEDITANVEMSFQKIISLTDLLLEHDGNSTANILTIRDLAQAGLNKFQFLFVK
jgi:hypothetical protein